MSRDLGARSGCRCKKTPILRKGGMTNEQRFGSKRWSSVQESINTSWPMQSLVCLPVAAVNLGHRRLIVRKRKCAAVC
uniref:Uncharacterized protein n=1 Tax=Nelumbo nucifera TaxID=4432 RepID=A0A822Z4I7_NELNU|nr:TPA_asm: hypothetical protein HUJ06_012904 [Nelumbo nucifera]